MRGKINPFSSSEFALLGFLYEKPTHGYDLHKLITDPDGIGLIWNVKMSNLYAYLDKLDKKGYIHGTMQTGDAHPTRMEYQITEKGKNAFESWLPTVVQHPRDFRQEFMLRYYFHLKYQPEKANALIIQQHQECSLWLENTVILFDKVAEEDQFKKSVIHFRLAQIQSMIKWLNRLHIAINKETPNEKI
ncbi:MAG: PadR family transcriptional regulator [Anaerolineaceae bacterium]|nr:PadR family transcriptional regulator [Anaerolineaceae bacterium]